ncbi:MAG: F0F1 ATP synthase subunit B [Cytophagales bacterium]|nr:F0F1 ATP synthase subunit B [Cytophagales bacterium]MDW8383992.1 F0F1 ATP synthase subunit B [Flammeovirgaceae bacterium]
MDIVTPNVGLLFWTSFLFLIVLVLLGQFAFKPIMNAIKEREQTIQEQLDAAKRAKEKMQELTKENERLIAEGRAEKEKIIADAKKAAAKIIEDAEQKAKIESSKIIASAQEAIQNEKKAALAEVRRQVASLSLEIAEKILRKELEKAGAHESLIEAYLKDVKLN